MKVSSQKRRLHLDSRLIKKTDKKDELLAELKNSRILDRVREVISDRIEATSKTSATDYDVANWAYLRADQDGYIRALTDVLNLIKK
jgi:hypothetical protein